MLLTIGRNLWLKLNPPPPPAPTVSFGKLPKLVFPKSDSKEPIKLTFKLETIQGGLPTLSDAGKVYFMPQKNPNLLDPERAYDLAQKMGFSEAPETVSQVLYRWKSSGFPSILEMNINTGNFHLTYDYQNDEEILTSKNLPTDQQAAGEAKNFLVSNGLLADDLAEGTAEFDYLLLNNGQVSPVSSVSEANLVRVNLFRSDLDSLTILPPNPKKALISFLFSSARTTGKRVIEINYTYSPLEREAFGTYPLKTVSQAWNELQDGGGFLAHLEGSQEEPIIVRKIYLAYYDSPEPQHYFQPIYVFEGDRNYFGYVPAIDPKWTEQ